MLSPGLTTKIFAIHVSDKRIISKIYNEIIQFHSKKKRKKKLILCKKWAEDLKTVFQKRHTYGKQILEKVLNISNH